MEKDLEKFRKELKLKSRQRKVHENLVNVSKFKNDKFLKTLLPETMEIFSYWNSLPREWITHHSINPPGNLIKTSLKIINSYLKEGKFTKEEIMKRFDKYVWLCQNPKFKLRFKKKYKMTLLIYLIGLEAAYPNQRFARSHTSSIIWFDICGSESKMAHYLSSEPVDKKMFELLKQAMFSELNISVLSPGEYNRVVDASNRLIDFSHANADKFSFEVTKPMWVRYLIDALKKKYNEKFPEYAFNVLGSDYTFGSVFPSYLMRYHEMMSDGEHQIVRRQRSLHQRIDQMNR